MAGPLAGIRVLDLSRVLAGPWASQMFADMGADVVKIERPGEGDDTRKFGPPWIRDAATGENVDAAYYASCNRGKRSVTLDISTAEGQAIVGRLVDRSDVLVENYKVGALAKYGLDYASVAKRNPRIVYCSITGFGQTGPYRNRPGYDFLIQGMGGLMSVTGERDELPGGGPQRFGVPIVDLFTGMYATISILAALNHRNVTGEGQHIDVSLMGAVLAMSSGQLSNYMIGGKLPGRTGNASPNITPYGVYPCSDGLFIVASANQGQFTALCKALEHPEWVDDPRFKDNGARMAHQSELHALFSQILSTKPRAHWESLFLEVGVPAGPINDYAQAMAHPQAQHLKARISIPHPTGVEAPGIANPMRFSKTPVTYRRPPPMLGQHTQEVLQELGLDQAAIDALLKAGAVKFG